MVFEDFSINFLGFMSYNCLNLAISLLMQYFVSFVVIL